MAFSIGDRVIHCYHGPGRITRLDRVQSREGTRDCYVVSMAQGLVVWVPIDGTSENKLRSPMPANAVDGLRAVLRAPAQAVSTDSRQREQDIRALIKDGSPVALCTVLRDLTAYATRRTLNAADTAALDKARTILVSEWVSATGAADAADEVETLLKDVARRAIDGYNGRA